MGKFTQASDGRTRIKVNEAIAKLAPDLINVNYRVPKNLSASELKKFTPDSIEETEWIDACRFVAGTILDRQERFVEYGKFDEVGVPISSKLFKKILSNNYFVLRKQMEKIGLIKLVLDYSYGKGNDHSKIFVLGKDYLTPDTKTRPITHKAIKKRIIRWKKEMWEDQQRKMRQVYYVLQWLFDGGLEIDKGAAIQAINELETSVLSTAAKIKNQAKRERVIKNVNWRYSYAKRLIIDWESNVSQKVKLDKAGRLYNVLSGLPSIIRNFMTYKGQKLVALDIKNSQPLHSLWLLRKEFWDDETDKPHPLTLKALNKELYKNIRKNLTQKGIENTHQYFIKSQKKMEVVDNQSISVFTFEEVVKSGKLYEFIANRFRQKFPGNDGKRFADRASAKEEMMIIFYNDNARTPSISKNAYSYFRQLFPDITAFMELLKHKSYKDFSVFLQRLEAKMILQDVCREIYENHIEIPLFTIHDSIITTAAYEKKLKKIILKKYNDLLGFDIRLKAEKLEPLEFLYKSSEYVHNKLELEYNLADIIFPKHRTTKPAKTGRKLKPAPIAVPFPDIDAEIRKILLQGELPENIDSYFPNHLNWPYQNIK
jgi:hypothetical protein